MICSNNSMLWRTASLFTAVIQVTTRVTCDAWRVHINNDTRRSSKTFKTWNFRSFLRTHSLNNEYLYNTYIFWPLFNVNCSVLRPQNVCKRSLPGGGGGGGGTHRIFRIQCGKNSRQHFCFKLVNLYLLYEMRNRVWRDCKQLSLNKSMFSLKTFKASRHSELLECLQHCKQARSSDWSSRCSNVRHNSVMSVQPSNVAITPPPEGI